MERKYSKQYLEVFLNKFNFLTGKESPKTLGDYYFNNVFKSSRDLEEEILENNILLPIESYKAYLEFVIKKMKREIISVIDSSFLEKWNEKYDFKKNSFSVKDEFGVLVSLNKWGEFLNLNCFEDITITEKQLDADLFAFYIEAIKIIDFINSLLVERGYEAIEETSGIENKKIIVPGKEIVVNAGAKVKPEKVEVNNHSGFNEHVKSTIEEYLIDIVDDINPNDYKILEDALYSYFTTGKFPKLKNKIMFKRVNKKKVGWALKEVYKNIKTEALVIEYFRFAKENINIFSKEVIDSTNFNKTNFYKVFTTNPAN